MSKLTERGAMRTRITIESQTQGTDGQGGGGLTWTTFASSWCKLEGLTPKKGGEEFFAGQIRGITYYRVTMPYQAGVDVSMRINAASLPVPLLLNIRNIVDTDERHRELVILAEGGVAQ